MKFTNIAMLLATVGSVIAVPTTDAAAAAADSQVVSNIMSAYPADGALACRTDSNSGYVVDAESLVRYLKGLHKHQICDTNLVSSSGTKYATYALGGNVQFDGVVTNPKCSIVNVNCRVLGGYYQNMINACKAGGRIEAIHYLNPNQFTFTNPKLCKKTANVFALGILPWNHTTT